MSRFADARMVASNGRPPKSGMARFATGEGFALVARSGEAERVPRRYTTAREEADPC
jgi:hypothetical protein